MLLHFVFLFEILEVLAASKTFLWSLWLNSFISPKVSFTMTKFHPNLIPPFPIKISDILDKFVCRLFVFPFLTLPFLTWSSQASSSLPLILTAISIFLFLWCNPSVFQIKVIPKILRSLIWHMFKQASHFHF